MFLHHPKLSQRAHRIMIGMGSLLNDTASDMIYPLLPIFLTSILHTPVAIIGIIFGIAEASANFSKLIFGWLSDKVAKRKCFIVAGYSLSAIEKVIMGLSPHWFFVLLARSADRMGKGMRTPARDALIVENTTPDHQARAFGLHRTLDGIGAIIGPLIGLALLYMFNDQLRPIFFFTAIPSALCIIVMAVYVHDVRPPRPPVTHLTWSWIREDKRFLHFLIVTGFFGLANSSDLFFILRSYDLGLSLHASVLAYVSYQLFQTLFSYPAGVVADRIGIKTVVFTGFLVFAAVSCTWALMPSPTLIWVLFPLYGVYMAFTDGMGRAYIARIVPHEHLASAFGLHQALLGTCALLASSIAGILWTTWSQQTPFFFSAIMALIAAGLFALRR